VAIVLCLGKPADVYLIDEPSAYLDSEQRISAAKVIKRFIMHSRKTLFCVGEPQKQNKKKSAFLTRAAQSTISSCRRIWRIA
jgi:ABC-type thiamine transport system ATPase subunit